jgi:hypothetical protein
MKTIKTIDGPVRVPEGPMDLTGPQWLQPRNFAVTPDDVARARRDEVAEKVPAAAVAWNLAETALLRCQPILFAEDEHNALWRGPVFGSSAEAVEYYDRWPSHGVGVASGQQSADWGLLALWCRDGGAWRRWVVEHGTVELANPHDSRERTRREYRELGGPAVIYWQPVETGPPYSTPRIFPTTRDAAVDQHARLALLESITHPSEQWLCYPYLGRATWKARTLAFGVELRGMAEPIPVESTLAGYRLATAGSLMRPETSSTAWAPPWLLDELKVKVTT